VFVLPTLEDYRAVSVLEAMRFGKPVIVSSRDGMSVTVADVGNGFVIDPLDVRGLADCMRVFIDQPSAVASMGSASLEAVRALTPEACAAGLVETIEEAAARRRGKAQPTGLPTTAA
jgi:glycosyltransferase involved in cell wall biosynthesis